MILRIVAVKELKIKESLSRYIRKNKSWRALGYYDVII